MTRSKTNPANQINENKLVVQRVWRDLVNGERPASLPELVNPDFLDHTPLPGLTPDLEGLTARLAMLHQAFPDIKSTIIDLTPEGDKVVVMCSTTGTHKNSFLG